MKTKHTFEATHTRHAISKINDQPFAANDTVISIDYLIKYTLWKSNEEGGCSGGSRSDTIDYSTEASSPCSFRKNLFGVVLLQKTGKCSHLGLIIFPTRVGQVHALFQLGFIARAYQIHALL